MQTSIEFSPLITQHLKGRNFMVMVPFEFVFHGDPIVHLPPGVVPSRYVTDLASIPNIVRGLLDKDSEHSAVMHDHIVEYGFYWSQNGSKIYVPRSLGDKLFYIGLRSEGEDYNKKNWFLAQLMYRFVRVNSIIKVGFN